MRGLVVMFAIAACGSPGSATGDGPAGDDDDGSVTDGPGTTGDAPPDPCEPGTWCTETSPVANILLRAVWAADLNNVFAAGDNGTILHRRNNVWTAMDTPTTSDLRGLWGLSATDIWAAGADGALLHYDGASWTAQGSFTTDFAGVWASGTDDVWITHAGGVTHWNGNQFETTTLPGELFAISGSGPDDVWVTGENSKVHHYTGTWTTGIDPDAGAGATYFAILALAPTDVWVSTFTPNKQTVNFTGSWAPHAANATFQGFHAVGTDDIWAAGGSKAGHWTGSSWAVEMPAGNVAMLGIGGVGASFWIVGNNGLILHRR